MTFSLFRCLFVGNGGKEGGEELTELTMQVKFCCADYFEEACEKERREDERLSQLYIHLPLNEKQCNTHPMSIAFLYKKQIIAFGRVKTVNSFQSGTYLYFSSCR